MLLRLKRHMIVTIWLLMAALMVTPVVVSAQQPTPQPAEPAVEVSRDEVNAVARRLYCPVCENEPVHTCMAPTCVQWRGEIRDQLEQGRSSDAIVDYFVALYGDQVVGLPQDEGLRALAIAGPLAVLLAAVGIGLWTILHWRRNQEEQAQLSSASGQQETEDDSYRNRLENDLRY
ncbi:MAG: cytochrome c-type biogenesis protein [Chloroflexota bacterium]